MKRSTPTPAAIRAALAAQALRTSRYWRVHWEHHEPTIARYQEPVTLARVLSEHYAALGAEPMEH